MVSSNRMGETPPRTAFERFVAAIAAVPKDEVSSAKDAPPKKSPRPKRARKKDRSA